MACQAQSEQTSDYITGVERHWIAHFGPPGMVTDEGHLSDEHSIAHEVAPGEAHERLGQVER